MQLAQVTPDQIADELAQPALEDPRQEDPEESCMVSESGSFEKIQEPFATKIVENGDVLATSSETIETKETLNSAEMI